MGLAIVNEATCLPMAGKEDCHLCVQECIAAGYNAIEYIQVGTRRWMRMGFPSEVVEGLPQSFSTTSV